MRVTGVEPVGDASDGPVEHDVLTPDLTTTTRPCSSAGPSGSELSHSVAPPSEGMCTRANTDI